MIDDSGMSKRRRIVHLVCTDAFAGTERYVANLAAGLDRVWGPSYEVIVLGGSEAGMVPALGATGVTWHPAGSVAAGIVALNRLGRVGLVHAHLTAAEFAALACKPRNLAPIVASRHIAKRRGTSGVARAAGALITRSLTAQIAVSDFVAANVEGESTVIRPGTPAVAGDPAPASSRDRTVLVAQRLELEKRTDLALHVWASSGLGALGWSLIIAGDGSLARPLAELANELGIADSVQFVGHQDDLVSLRRSASMMFASCPTEPFGLSVVEAMAEGIPVVAVRGAGHDETVGDRKSVV